MLGQPTPDQRGQVGRQRGQGNWSPYGRGQYHQYRWPGRSNAIGDDFSNQTTIGQIKQVVTDPQAQAILDQFSPQDTLDNVWQNLDPQTQSIINYSLQQTGSTSAVAAFNLKQHKIARRGIGLQQTQITVNPNLLELFKGDEDALHDFLESLEDHEMSIMNEHGHDVNVLKKLVIKVRGDVDGTSKDLEMDG